MTIDKMDNFEYKVYMFKMNCMSGKVSIFYCNDNGLIVLIKLNGMQGKRGEII
jgi:hypothetical protein